MEQLNYHDEGKSKSIIIDGELHHKFKVLCKGKCMKIGAVIEDLIRLYINNPKKIQIMIDESKDLSEEL